MAKVVLFKTHLSEWDRNVIAIIVAFFNCVPIISAFCLFLSAIFTYYHIIKRSLLLDQTVSITIFLVFYSGITLVVLIQDITLSYFLYISRRSKRRKTLIQSKAFNSIVYIYVFTTVLLIPSLMIYAMYCINNIDSGLLNGLKIAMNSYSKNIEWKILMDEIQFTYECCGAKTYSDWFTVDWIKDKIFKSYINQSSSLPFSCCRIDAEMCLNHNIDNRYGITYNTRGCGHIVSEWVTEPLYWAQWLWALILAVHVFTVLLFQLWKTSVENALLLGHPKRRADGLVAIPDTKTFIDNCGKTCEWIKQVFENRNLELKSKGIQYKPLLSHKTMNTSKSNADIKQSKPRFFAT